MGILDCCDYPYRQNQYGPHWKEVTSMAKSVTKDVEGPIRISISVEPKMRKNMRIAAAHSDQSVGEWATKILARAAAKATGQSLPEEE
jgi:hypothetical protein